MTGILALPVVAAFGPEIAVAALAVAAVMILFVIDIALGNPLGNAMRGVPVIGGYLADAVARGIASVKAWANQWAGSLVQPLIALVLVPVQWAVGIGSVVVGTFEYIMGTLRVFMNATAQAVALAWQADQAARSSINRLLGAVFGAAAGLAAAWAAIHWTQSTAIPAARQQAVTEAAGYTRSQVGAEAILRRDAVAGEATRRTAAALAEHNARVAAEQRQAAEAAAADKALGNALAGLRSTVVTQVEPRVGELEDELTRVRTQTIPKVQAQEAADVATLTAELSLAQEALKCLDPLCKSGFSNLVGGLFAGAELLALLELVGAAIHDPEGQARDTAGSVGTPLGAVSGLLSGVLGVQF